MNPRRKSNFLLENEPSQIYYPPNVVRLGCSIPEQFVSKLTTVGDEIKVHVGDLRNPSRFWVILKPGLLDLSDLMYYLQKVYFDEGQSECLKIFEKDLTQGMFCVAMYQGEYNRGIIRKIIPKAHLVEVVFVDYGTVALIDSSSLYFLLEKFSFLPRQAIKAKLADIRPRDEAWSRDSILNFSNMVGEFKELTARIVRIDRTNKILRIVLKDIKNGESIGDTLIENGFAHDVSIEELKQNSINQSDVVKLDNNLPKQFDLHQIQEKKEVKLLVSNVLNPARFWVTLNDSYEDLQKLSQELQVTYNTGSIQTNIPKTQLKEGMLCVASNGSKFCRATIKRVRMESHQADIFFFDHGRNFTVDLSQLHFLYERFARVPRQAFKATLTDLAPFEQKASWSSEATRRFSELVRNKPLIAKISSWDPKNEILKVLLMDRIGYNRKCINDILIEEKLASLDF